MKYCKGLVPSVWPRVTLFPCPCLEPLTQEDAWALWLVSQESENTE